MVGDHYTPVNYCGQLWLYHLVSTANQGWRAAMPAGDAVCQIECMDLLNQHYIESETDGCRRLCRKVT